MEALRAEGFVQGDSLEWYAGGGLLWLEGEIACCGNIVINVKKALEIVDASDPDNPDVQTFLYAYNAHIRGHGNISRYDNEHAHPGHADAHHKHVYDWHSGEQIAGSPFEWIRHRLRALRLKQWKRGKTMFRELRALGASVELAARVAGNARRWWRNSAMNLHIVMPISYFDRLGIPRLAT
jgi:hypothetical protein